jgi:hypothetical protein
MLQFPVPAALIGAGHIPWLQGFKAVSHRKDRQLLNKMPEIILDSMALSSSVFSVESLSLPFVSGIKPIEIAPFIIIGDV